MPTSILKQVIIGGGAAGFFGAIICARRNPQIPVIILEKSKQLLSKVRISGGGRCNVTHACFDPAVLVKHYPRGEKALLGPFHRFQPRDTVEWFRACGVDLKTEEDGRMFPITDDSETIIDCLTHEARKMHVEIQTLSAVQGIESQSNLWKISLQDGREIDAANVLFAAGSSPAVYEILGRLGHRIVPPVPSLFTFNVPDSPMSDLAGLSVPQARVKILPSGLEQTGPLLITHWGFSGPAILKLSAWGARVLHEQNYSAVFRINWIPDLKEEQLKQKLQQAKLNYPQKIMANEFPLNLPKNLWKRFCSLSGISEDQRWANLSSHQIQTLCGIIHAQQLNLQGKTTYKQEFVTSGGVDLDEVNFKTMESRLFPGVYFAGEILNIDGVTGGFNFQNAWTTGWIAGNAMAERVTNFL